MNFATIVLATVLTTGTANEHGCITRTDVLGNTLTCCIEPDGRQCCSGTVEENTPVGCDCQIETE